MYSMLLFFFPLALFPIVELSQKSRCTSFFSLHRVLRMINNEPRRIGVVRDSRTDRYAPGTGGISRIVYGNAQWTVGAGGSGHSVIVSLNDTSDLLTQIDM